MTFSIPYSEKSQGRISLEVEIQRVASAYGFAPKILDVNYCEAECVITTEEIYGFCPENTESSWDDILSITSLLFNLEGIYFNKPVLQDFIEEDGRIYIINFSNACYKHGRQ